MSHLSLTLRIFTCIQIVVTGIIIFLSTVSMIDFVVFDQTYRKCPTVSCYSSKRAGYYEYASMLIICIPSGLFAIFRGIITHFTFRSTETRAKIQSQGKNKCSLFNFVRVNMSTCCILYGFGHLMLSILPQQLNDPVDDTWRTTGVYLTVFHVIGAGLVTIMGVYMNLVIGVVGIVRKFWKNGWTWWWIVYVLKFIPGVVVPVLFAGFFISSLMNKGSGTTSGSFGNNTASSLDETIAEGVTDLYPIHWLTISSIVIEFIMFQLCFNVDYQFIVPMLCDSFVIRETEKTGRNDEIEVEDTQCSLKDNRLYIDSYENDAIELEKVVRLTCDRPDDGFRIVVSGKDDEQERTVKVKFSTKKGHNLRNELLKKLEESKQIHVQPVEGE